MSICSLLVKTLSVWRARNSDGTQGQGFWRTLCRKAIKRAGGFSLGYIPVEGLEFETADRHGDDVARAGSQTQWLAQLDAEESQRLAQLQDAWQTDVLPVYRDLAQLQADPTLQPHPWTPDTIAAWAKANQAKLNMGHAGVGSVFHLSNARVGSRYSVARLLNLMITNSDNTAANMLIRLVGRVHINQEMQALGLTWTGHLANSDRVRNKTP